MALLPSPTTNFGWRGVRTLVSDLLIATALIWMLPLLFGALNAVAELLMDAW